MYFIYLTIASVKENLLLMLSTVVINMSNRFQSFLLTCETFCHYVCIIFSYSHLKLIFLVIVLFFLIMWMYFLYTFLTITYLYLFIRYINARVVKRLFVTTAIYSSMKFFTRAQAVWVVWNRQVLKQWTEITIDIMFTII